MPTSHISKINRFCDKINKKMIFFLFNFIGYFWPLFFSLISEVTCRCMFREKRMYTPFYLWNQRKLCVWLWNLIIWSRNSWKIPEKRVRVPEPDAMQTTQPGHLQLTIMFFTTKPFHLWVFTAHVQSIHSDSHFLTHFARLRMFLSLTGLTGEVSRWSKSSNHIQK